MSRPEDTLPSLSATDSTSMEVAMQPLPGMSDTDLALESFAENLNSQKTVARDRAGQLATFKALQAHAWEEHAKSTLEPLEQVIDDTCALLAKQSPFNIVWYADAHQYSAEWRFRKIAHVSGHDLQVDTAALIVPHLKDKEERIQMDLAWIGLRRPKPMWADKNRTLLGVEPTRVPGTGFRLNSLTPRYEYEPAKVLAAVGALAVRQPRYMLLTATAQAIGSDETTTLHTTGVIQTAWCDPAERAIDFNPSLADKTLYNLPEDPTVEDMLNYLKQRAGVEEAELRPRIVSLTNINGIIRDSFALTADEAEATQ